MTLLIICLTLATAAIHLSFFVESPGRGLIYALNALGYVTLAATLYLPVPSLNDYRRIARRTLMGYTALTIAAYVAFGILRHKWTVPLGPADKLIEVTLIALLWRDDLRSSR